MSSSSPSYERLLAECEKEPIHTPGAIQPFGVLLVVERPSLIISNASENSAASWNKPALELLGHSLSELLGPEDIARLETYLDAEATHEQSPLFVRIAGAKEEAWEVRAHHLHGLTYLEFEPASKVHGSMRFHAQVRDAVRLLQGAGSVQDLCDKAVQQVREITGFERVMVYRFDPDWHGVVISEACAPGVHRYLGHHFPASDIPAQARAVFLQNWLRMIPDAAYTPSQLHPDVHPHTGERLDLGRTLLRSVSPIHLVYLRNMGVKASLTISLIEEGKLWGLIACHHMSPHFLDSDTRIAAELIGRLVSAQLRAKEEQEHHAYQRRIDKAVDELLESMESAAQAGDLSDVLSAHAPRLLEPVHAARGSVAVRYGGKWTISGSAPTVPQLQALASWLGGRFEQHYMFHTDRLEQLYPPAQAFRTTASGLLAVCVGKAEGDCLIWMRPEVAATVTWAGSQEKTVETVEADGPVPTLHPRTSFDSWTEEVRGLATPWKSVELDAVEKLRNGVLALALEQEHRKELAARRRAERLSREKDEMVMMVSHDLRTPLNVLSMCLSFIRQFNPSGEAPVQRMLVRGERAVDLMVRLITNILDVAKIEAGTLDLVLKEESAVDLIRDAADLALPLAEEKGVRLTLCLPDGPTPYICCEKVRIQQVLNNFLSNALKFTPRGGNITFSLREEGNDVVFSIADTGEGIAPEDLERIFERFWQAEDTKRHGTGLGLWIAKAMIAMHRGRIWASSEPGKGSTFSFALRSQAAPI